MLSSTEAYRSIVNPAMQLLDVPETPHRVACLIWAGRSKELAELLSQSSAGSLSRRTVTFETFKGHMPTSWKKLPALMYQVWEYAFPACDPSLDTPIQPFQTTPLMLAAMCSDAVSTRLLLAAGASPTAVDRRGWTATHHAAMHEDGAVFKLLVEADADLSARTDEGGTVTDLRAIVSAQRPDPNERNVRIWDDKTKQVVTKSAREVFGEGVCFSAQTYASAAFMIRAWSAAQSEAERLMHGVEEARQTLYPAFRRQFRQLHKEEPKVYVGKCVSDRGQMLPAGIGLGLYASAEFSPADFICSYGGEFLDSKAKADTSYLVGENLQGRRLRYYAVMASDSFPNAALEIVKAVDGCNRAGLRALTAIRPGEAICVCYGKVDAKWATHWEQHPAMMREWIRKNPLSSFLKGGPNEFFPSVRAGSYDPNANANTARLAYIINTPTALCSLALERLITAEQVTQLKQYIRKQNATSAQALFRTFEENLEATYLPFFKAYEKLNSAFAMAVREALEGRLQKGSVPVVCGLMSVLTPIVNEKEVQRVSKPTADDIKLFKGLIAEQVDYAVNGMAKLAKLKENESTTLTQTTAVEAQARAARNQKDKARKKAAAARKKTEATAGGASESNESADGSATERLESKADGKKQTNAA